MRARDFSFETPANRSGSQTLENTSAQGISVGSWKTKPNSGRSQLQAISPRVGAARPVRSLRTVDLPQPDGPRRARNSPPRISRSSPDKAMTLLAKTLSTPLNLTSGAALAFEALAPAVTGKVSTFVI